MKGTSSSLPTLRLAADLESALASGHPWIYRNHLPRHALRGGEWVQVTAGRQRAFGLYDAEGAIGVRLFSREGVPERGWLRARVEAALALRAGLSEQGTDAYRLLYGEGDYLPGIVADRYGRYAAIKSYTDSVERLLPEVAALLGRALGLRGVVRRREGVLEPLWGEVPPPELTVTENGLSFLANLHEGQKTGLFLDHRDNRQVVRGLAAGKRVANLFGYTGAFSVYALAGGATHAVSVDSAAPALHDAERNVALNGLPPEQHDTVQADVFELLGRWAEQQRRFELIVVDPPAMARNRRQRHAALRAYRRLGALAMRCLSPGGLLGAASCTAQVSPDDFKGALAEAAADAEISAQIVHEAGHARDHPIPLAFPEGRYLKFVVLRVGERP